MSARLPPDEAAALVALLETFPAGEPMAISSYQPPGQATRQYVASIPVRGEKGLTVVSTLGSLCDRLYLAATDGDPGTLLEAVARTEHHDARGRGLDVGHALRFERGAIAERGWASVFIGVPPLLELLAEVPAEIVAGARRLRPRLCILLTPDEQALLRSRGADALLDRLEATGRSLVAAHPPGG